VVLIHPPPQQVAVSHCPACGAVDIARVNQMHEIEPRYCTIDRTELVVALYAFEREVKKGG
jgi:hypothetical protein